MKLLISKSASKALDKIPDKLARKIAVEIQKLGENPFSRQSRKLVGQDNYRIRIGVYRVIYWVDKKNQRIIILRIAHRREVYR